MKAILFDANGVLYHRSGQHAYLRAFLRQQHRTVPSADEIWRIRDDIRQQLPQATRRERQAALLTAVGVADPHMVAMGLEALDTDEAAITLFADVRATLDQLVERGFLLGVVTNTAVSSAEKQRWLRAQQLHIAWRTFIASSEVGARKPDPRIYQLALAECAVPPSAALFVGHSAEELAGAQAVGLYTVGVRADPGAVADALLDTFADLLRLPLLQRPT